MARQGRERSMVSGAGLRAVMPAGGGRRGRDRRIVGRRARRLAIATAVCFAAVSGGASADAASISLRVSADPAEDRAMTVTTSGVADGPSYFSVSVRPAGGAPCAATAGTDVGGDFINDGTYAAGGAYSSARTYWPEDPGRYLLCGWLQREGAAVVRTSTEVTVRSNAASLAFEVPATAVPDAPVVLTIRGATEIPRYVLATVKPAGGSGCGSAYSTDAGGSDVMDARVQGAFSEQRTETFEAGTYLLCAWVQESGGDLAPEAAAQALIAVLPPDRDGDGVPDATDRCPDQAAPGSSVGCPPRVAPAKFTAKAVRARDRRRPFRFTVKGRLTAPAGIDPAAACTGQVNVQFKRGTKTISARRRTIRKNCTWRSSVTFARRSRVGRSGRLKVMVRFLGNDVLTPRQAKTFRVRAG
jgi:hypothetical protein